MPNKIPSDTQWADLASRIKAKPEMSAILDLVYPVGSYYETSDTTFDPNTSWGGTWYEDADGRVLISRDNIKVAGDTGGTETHNHTYGMKYGEYYGYFSTNPKLLNGNENTWASGVDATTESWKQTTLTTGSSTKGNTTFKIIANTTSTSNMQPYKVIVRWHRIA